MSSPFLFVSCTRQPASNADSLLIVQSFKDPEISRQAKLEMVWENKEGLPTVYNKKIQEHRDSGAEYLVFVHDDVFIDDLKVCKKIRTAHEALGYEIIGVAGGLNPRAFHKAAWHQLCQVANLRGAIFNLMEDGSLHTAWFGSTPSRVSLLDGVFMAVHLPTIVKKSWSFNERYDFHHYDLAACLDALSKGISLGVYPIHLFHKSTGLLSFDDPDWLANNKRFLYEYPLPSR